jgi:DNA-binding beta-propeller fold protein YncE
MIVGNPRVDVNMKMLQRGLLCGLIILALGGCAASGIRQTPNALSAFAPRQTLPSHDVLYVSDPILSRVDIYPLNTNNPAPIGEIRAGLETPTGMAVDSSHLLYVANNTDNKSLNHTKGTAYFVSVYAPGSGFPETMYSQDLHHPSDVAVGADGTVYVASYGDGYVTEYPPGSKTPSQHFQPPSGSPIAVALDANNNLYVACALANAVFEFPPGSTVGTNLGLVLGGEPHGMAFDTSGNLLVAVSKAPNSGSVVDVFAPGATMPSAQIGGVFQPFMIDFDQSKRHLYVADYGSGNHDGAVFEFAYPSGTLVGKYSQGAASAAYGVAVNPPAP